MWLLRLQCCGVVRPTLGGKILTYHWSHKLREEECVDNHIHTQHQFSAVLETCIHHQRWGLVINEQWLCNILNGCRQVHGVNIPTTSSKLHSSSLTIIFSRNLIFLAIKEGMLKSLMMTGGECDILVSIRCSYQHSPHTSQARNVN